MAEYKRGEMDISQHKRMYESFLQFWVYLFGGAVLVLIFLALTNS